LEGFRLRRNWLTTEITEDSACPEERGKRVKSEEEIYAEVDRESGKKF